MSTVDYASFLSLWREEQSVINSEFWPWSTSKNCIYKVCQLEWTNYIKTVASPKLKMHATESQVIIRTWYNWYNWGCMQFSMSFSKGSMAPCKWIQLSLCAYNSLEGNFPTVFIVISKSQVYAYYTFKGLLYL